MRSINVSNVNAEDSVGFCHLAFDMENKDALIVKMIELKAKNVRVISDARVTGDGYFESVIADFDGNKIELSTTQF
ncbi:MAG TPA: hypothetical protein PK638_04035 [Candidatus Enterocola sp.]|nr:hypothetical protein [Candidatus Enterocola sp.]